ncbi:hypothetical protein CHS0354_037354 [Potamilus streckersoni]|uniref:Uncharacterized protein n=1 Tax=Potamilus streckersoni TaxID=2493646 RepID=A0AAE0S493_9BIVA|nr:hypothetical protein CHS0354_037354 [Potamilus streckersoni]
MHNPFSFLDTASMFNPFSFHYTASMHNPFPSLGTASMHNPFPFIGTASMYHPFPFHDTESVYNPFPFLDTASMHNPFSFPPCILYRIQLWIQNIIYVAVVRLKQLRVNFSQIVKFERTKRHDSPNSTKDTIKSTPCIIGTTISILTS